jgi:hypothetical protein
MKISAKRESALEEIYSRQPISIHNIMIDKRTLNWLERNEYIKVSSMINVAVVTPKGADYLKSHY